MWSYHLISFNGSHMKRNLNFHHHKSDQILLAIIGLHLCKSILNRFRAIDCGSNLRHAVLSDPIRRIEYDQNEMQHVYDYNLIVRCIVCC